LHNLGANAVSPALLTLSNTVSSDTLDPNPANDQDTVTTSVTPPRTSTPDLVAADDSGFSSSDDLTNVMRPHFDVLTKASLLVELIEGGDILGSALADLTGLARIQVDAAHAFADGIHRVSARARLDASTPAGPESDLLSVTIDTVAPDAPVLDLPAAEDSGSSHTDNITNVALWHFVSNNPGEPGQVNIVELAPNGRVLPQSFYADGASGCYCYYYPDTGGGLGADRRQGVWTYWAYGEDLAGNTSPWSNSLAITFDSVAPTTPVLDLPAGEDSGSSHTDNITNVGAWHFWANSLGEQGFFQTRELAPGGRDITSAIPTVPAGTPCCGYYYYPDTGGGGSGDGRQGVWTYWAYGEDLAGNTSPWSNSLAITFDSVAPTGSFKINNDLPLINGQIATKDPHLALQLAFTDSLSGMSEMRFSSDGGTTFQPAGPYGANGALTLVGPDNLYAVAVQVTDVAGNTFTVTKQIRLDTTGPAITTAGVASGASYELGTVLTFTFGATDVDNVSAIHAVLDGTTNLASGGTILIDSLMAGSHSIVVAATDQLGNTSQVTITFEVHASAMGLCSAVSDGVRRGLIDPNMENPLCAKARAAQAALDRRDYTAARGVLGGFINQVAAQSGKKIAGGYAGLLNSWANYVIAHLP
jgi:hypothetical protein